MHVFQPYPIYMLDWNPFEKIGRESVAIMAEADGRANAMSSKNATVGTFLGKNVLVAFVRNSRFTKELLDKSDSFSACFFDMNEKSNKHILQILDAVSGRNEDKLAECKINVGHSMNIPYIDEANFIILCKKMAAIPMSSDGLCDNELIQKFYSGKYEGDNHTLYIGEIKDIMVR